MCKESVGAGRLRHIIYPSDYVPRTILDNANRGKLAVVALGTTANMRKNLMFGSVSGSSLTN